MALRLAAMLRHSALVISAGPPVRSRYAPLDLAVREVRAGVWHWEARHPEWNERQWWGPLVSSYAIDDGARLVLFDPLAPPAEIEQLTQDRETAIVLTCPWHRRDAGALASRYGAPLDFLGDLPNNVPAEQAAGTEQILERMQPLLRLPVEVVLPTHGAPTDKAALERALAASP
jgi:hypothetical protein